MINYIKRLIPRSLKTAYHNFRFNLNAEKSIRDWQTGGKVGAAPHALKRKIISAYTEKYKPEVFVETGTYLGDMIHAQKNNFKKLISIELDKDLWKKADQRFRSQPHIKILQGDSGSVLNEIVPQLTGPALFWLDGHYSGGITAKGDKECPILEELDVVLKQKQLKHVILIDDARCFVGANDYPTMEQLTTYIKGKRPEYNIAVEDDVIRVTV